MQKTIEIHLPHYENLQPFTTIQPIPIFAYYLLSVILSVIDMYDQHNCIDPEITKNIYKQLSI